MYTFATILSSYPILKYVTLLLAYMGLVRHLRFKRINTLLRKYPDSTLPLRDYKVAREVAANVATYEFPSLYVVGLDAMMAIWTHNGKALGIKDIPETLPELKAWAEEYSDQNTKYHPANTIATDPLVDLLIGELPEFLHQFCRKIFSGFISPQIREAIKLETPHAGLTLVFETLLKARGAFVKYFMLPRRLPKVRTALRINQDMKYVPAFHDYGVVRPDGYRIEDIDTNTASIRGRAIYAGYADTEDGEAVLTAVHVCEAVQHRGREFEHRRDDAYFQNIAQHYCKTNLKIISVALETPTKKCIDFTLTEVSRPYKICNLKAHGISDLPGYIFRECGLRPAQRFAEDFAK
ncbi:hypothetical protein BGZ98_006091 [Dissophora globulifera]|nr:hypothetical protein BGZ98_006091 [Dissophora globulifera]